MRSIDPHTVRMTDIKLSNLTLIDESANDSRRSDDGDLGNAPHSLPVNDWGRSIQDRLAKEVLRTREHHASGPSTHEGSRMITTQSQSLTRRGDSLQNISVDRQKQTFSATRSLPEGAWKQIQLIQDFYPPFRLPNACHRKIVNPTSPSHIRENVIQPLELGSLPGMLGHLHHCVDCHSYRLYAHRRDEEAFDVGLDIWDAFGNTKFHYMAALNALRVIHVAGSDESERHLPKLLATNLFGQSWLFALTKYAIPRSLEDLARVLTFAKASAMTLCSQDYHGQTWLHRLLYSQDWSDCLAPEISSDKSLAIALLKLCVAYKINPYIRDNAGRDVFEKLKEWGRQESTAEGTNEPLWDVEKALDQHMQPCWSKDSRVKSWKALISSGLQQHITMDSGRYDEIGETPLHAFISQTNPCKEMASKSQEKLEELLQSLEVDSNALYMRDRVGLTPLHLAIRLSLPHVAGILLLNVASSGYCKIRLRLLATSAGKILKGQLRRL
jgi:hypothetical protein